MSFTGVKRRKEPIAKEAFSHHTLPAADRICHSREVLTRREAELRLNVVQKLKSVIAEGLEPRAVEALDTEKSHNNFHNTATCRNPPRGLSC